MNLDIITELAKEIVLETGNYIRIEQSHFDIKNVEVKGKHDYVTFVDRTSEMKLFNGLSKLLPGSGFIMEENTSRIKGDTFNWIIDPLDGTTNFIHGVPPFAISVALAKNNELVLGIDYEVNNDECFYANQDSKSFLNGKEICVSNTSSIDESLVATGFPYYEYDRLPAFMKTLEYFFKKSRGVRRLGSAATDLVYVACGRFDCFYEYNLNPWDVAAGAIIVKNAGGKVVDFSGNDNFLFGREIIATNSVLSDEYFNVINKLMC